MKHGDMRLIDLRRCEYTSHQQLTTTGRYSRSLHAKIEDPKEE
jgi:hypothetical protein